MSKTIVIAKPAAKPAAKTKVAGKAKPAAKSNPMSAIVDTVTKPAPVLTDAQKAKAERDAERAKRYPMAAAQEAAKAKGKPAKVEKAKADKKAAVKKEPTVPFVARKASKGQALHLLTIGGRPSNGSLLFAHTHAVLTVLNLLDSTRPVVPKAHLMQMLGQTAVTHHTKRGTFEDAPDFGLRVSADGRKFFSERMATGKVDTKAANAFVAMLLDGKLDHSVTGIKQGNVYQVKF